MGKDTPTSLEFKEGYFSIKDKIKDILRNEKANAIFFAIISEHMPGNKPNSAMIKMIEGMKMEAVIKMAGKKAPEGSDIFINNKLQQIKK